MIYMNGVEVGSYNMPAPFSSTTTALSCISATTVNTTLLTINITDANILNGANALAVEVSRCDECSLSCTGWDETSHPSYFAHAGPLVRAKHPADVLERAIGHHAGRCADIGNAHILRRCGKREPLHIRFCTCRRITVDRRCVADSVPARTVQL